MIKASNFPTWDHVPLANLITEATGVAVQLIDNPKFYAVLDNDANAACAAECWIGAGKGKSNMVMISSFPSSC